jgi:CxxC motif-containing protein (DUF1111 family)
MMRYVFVIMAALFAANMAGAADDASIYDESREAFSHPVAGMSDAQREQFFRGRSLFQHSWIVAPSADKEFVGLGPLYNRLACASCHQKDGRGHAPDIPQARMQSMLVRLSVPGIGPHGAPKPHPAYGGQLNEEGVPGVPGEGRAKIDWRESSVTLADGTTVALREPHLEIDELAYGSLDGALTSMRVAPPVFGLGLLETVPVAALEHRAREKKPDGVTGRVNRVWDEQRRATVTGRFGLKANAPNVRQQIAGAFVGDLGITSPIFPDENCTPIEAACRHAPSGGHPELSGKQLDDIEFYVSHLAPPARREVADSHVKNGEAQFMASGCAVCHQPSLPTGKHAKYPLLSHKSIAPYTDLLIHDMGENLADHRPDYRAGGRDWRTPPLWGIGLVASVNETANFLHDGRARNFEEAILWHGGEGRVARDRYAKLEKAGREDLIRFLQSL